MLPISLSTDGSCTKLSGRVYLVDGCNANDRSSVTPLAMPASDKADSEFLGGSNSDLDKIVNSSSFVTSQLFHSGSRRNSCWFLSYSGCMFKFGVRLFLASLGVGGVGGFLVVKVIS